VDVAFNRPLVLPCGQRRCRSVSCPKDAAVNAGIPAVASGLPSPGRTRRQRSQEAVVFHQKRCVAVGTGTGNSGRNAVGGPHAGNQELSPHAA